MPDVLYPALHGRQHCPGGEDPIPCLGGEVVHLSSWNFDDHNTIPDVTWTPVTNATNQSYYENAFFKGDWIYDFDSGMVTLLPAATYHIQAWVQWGDDANDEETRALAINFGSSDRQIALYRFESVGVMGSMSQLKLTLSAFRSTTLGTTQCWLEVWHNHGSALALLDAEILVRRHEYFVNGTVESRP